MAALWRPIIAAALAAALSAPARADLLADIESNIVRYENEVQSIGDEADLWSFFLGLIERQGRVICPVGPAGMQLQFPVSRGVCSRWITEAVARGGLAPAQASAMASEGVRGSTERYRAELRKILADLEARREKSKAMLSYFLDQRDRIKTRPAVAQPPAVPPLPGGMRPPGLSDLPAGVRPDDDVWVLTDTEVRNGQAFAPGTASQCTVLAPDTKEPATIKWTKPQTVLQPGGSFSVELSTEGPGLRRVGHSLNASLGIEWAGWQADGPPRQMHGVYAFCPPGVGWECQTGYQLNARLVNPRDSFKLFVVCNGAGQQMVVAWTYRKTKAREVPQVGR